MAFSTWLRIGGFPDAEGQGNEFLDLDSLMHQLFVCLFVCLSVCLLACLLAGLLACLFVDSSLCCLFFSSLFAGFLLIPLTLSLFQI